MDSHGLAYIKKTPLSERLVVFRLVLAPWAILSASSSQTMLDVLPSEAELLSARTFNLNVSCFVEHLHLLQDGEPTEAFSDRNDIHCSSHSVPRAYFRRRQSRAFRGLMTIGLGR